MLGDTTRSNVFRLGFRNVAFAQGRRRDLGREDGLGCALSCGPSVGTREEALPSGILGLALPSPDSD